jgi:hypothetical protein
MLRFASALPNLWALEDETLAVLHIGQEMFKNIAQHLICT